MVLRSPVSVIVVVTLTLPSDSAYCAPVASAGGLSVLGILVDDIGLCFFVQRYRALEVALADGNGVASDGPFAGAFERNFGGGSGIAVHGNVLLDVQVLCMQIGLSYGQRS